VCGSGDQDCDGRTDEDPDEIYYRDRDGDGFGTSEESTMACTAASGYAVLATDCNDSNRNINPSTAEVCEGAMVDEDCDGDQNEGCGCPSLGAIQPCGPAPIGTCRRGTQT
jgi:hypothetical protein